MNWGSNAPGIDASKQGAGILMRTLKAGDGKQFPKRGETCKVHYVGRLESNGETFDSSRDRHQIFMFRLGMGQVIEGWDVAIANMSKGQIAELVIPAPYAYGEQGYPPLIPPNSALTFEVELLDFSQKY